MYRLIGSLKTRAFRVAWMLEELGLDYEHIAAAPRSADVTAADAGGKVPVLETPHGVLWDSMAIMTWLTDHHGRFTHPAGSFARARQDAASFQILDEIEGLLWMAARHSFVLPEAQRVPAIKDSLRWECARNLARLSERLGDGPYFAGDDPTVPDFLMTHCVNWAIGAKFPVEDAALTAHADRMRARPAYARVVQMRG